MKKLLFMLLVLSMAGAACKKSGRQNQTLPNPSPFDVAAELKADNPLNPFDDTGKLHNQVLEKVWQYVQLTGDTSSPGKVKLIAGHFSRTEGRDVAPAIERCRKKIALLGKGPMQPAISNAPLSQRSRELLTDLYKSLREADRENLYPLFRKSVLTVEARIATEKIPEFERTALFKWASILRYSGAYWLEKLDRYPLPDGTAPGGAAGKGRFLHWFTFVTADLLGGVVGTFEGDTQAGADYMSSTCTWYMDNLP
ncbi:hypothetical protein VRU48_19125 [Pedobacter sp. KR3-3]|uniref:Uncharacterized protein n=1 Tax=Pedobacter albus TaxID=3113905 RepID=A0ABU7ICQ1_9SPHI|nr:hypothetical protein [Pedobacter sp. KR3-3]MEE1947247.1 hypothetical protein [Pedobacter sp. KR3-3]